MKPNEKLLNGMPVKFWFVQREIYGGPYRSKPQGMFGIKMAKEIPAPCDIDVPTVDYRVPEERDLELGVGRALFELAEGRSVYVGCMGGIGRTGLFLAVLAKSLGIKDPIEYVRQNYNPHAVETKEQYRYVTHFPMRNLQLIARRAKWRAVKAYLKELLGLDGGPIGGQKTI